MAAKHASMTTSGHRTGLLFLQGSQQTRISHLFGQTFVSVKMLKQATDKRNEITVTSSKKPMAMWGKMDHQKKKKKKPAKWEKEMGGWPMVITVIAYNTTHGLSLAPCLQAPLLPSLLSQTLCSSHTCCSLNIPWSFYLTDHFFSLCFCSMFLLLPEVLFPTVQLANAYSSSNSLLKYYLLWEGFLALLM